MAFVRWRGGCAQLLATIYDQGHSRQILLANLHAAFYAPDDLKLTVAERFPDVPVDWRKVDRALAAGPARNRAPRQHLDFAEVEHLLRSWAREAACTRPDDAEKLRQAAYVLTGWRAERPTFTLPRKEVTPM